MGLDFIYLLPSWQEMERALKAGETRLRLAGIGETAKPFFLASLAVKINRPIIFIQPQKRSLLSLAERMNFYLSLIQPDRPLHIFPPLSEDIYQGIPPSLETISRRLQFLYHAKKSQVGFVLTNLIGLLKPVPSLSILDEFFLELNSDQPIERDYLLQRLKKFGYSEVEVIASPGEFAWRGGIIDVFSPWAKYPFRVEIAGEQISSLREFDVSTQRSRQKLASVTIPSLREFPTDEEFFRSWEEQAKTYWPTVSQEWWQQEILGNQDGLSSIFPFLALLMRDKFQPVLSLLPEALVVIDDLAEVEKEWADWQKDMEGIREELAKKNYPCLAPGEIFNLDLLEAIKVKALIIQDWDDQDGRSVVSFSFQPVPRFQNRISFFLDYLNKLYEEREQSFIFLSQPGLRERMASLLKDKNIPHRESGDLRDYPHEGEIILWAGFLDHGFSYPEFKFNLFGERDILTEEKVLVSRPSPRPFISHFQDLKAGDYVVHHDYGIGLFIGLVRLAVEGIDREFIEIHYRDGDKLYVPVEDLKLVQRYTPVGSRLPDLDKLGTQSWEKTKEKTRKAVEKLARDLLELYARRKAAPGYAFSPAGTWEEELDKTFPYEETEDQLRSIEEVKKDMESPSPMDRLLCGDVGYGKTEVALRAAFKAVMDGKQVAVLCPTTILASQHFKTFRQRLAFFPVRIEALTRLQTKAAQNRIVQELKKGLVDIIIGTHRLLSADVAFRDLGLLIIDEEQRFGVRQKEKIKKMKASVDVLTMSATPIPRTLNMSLSGLMDISLIETPPKDRLAIHTVVSTFNPRLVASAISQELARGGQVYYVHNQIEDIDRIAEMISRLVPQAKPVVIHGQMSSAQLEKRMIDFIDQKYNVLVSTTIIENGIDIPLVNTLIVDRADRYGLSQLYQLRGRVGRSSRQAFAYFLIPPLSELTPAAKERLKALKEFSQLGSGFRLAARDLEIRGAGNLLGPQQHGMMEAVGFDYFMQLLDKAIRELKGEKVEEVKCEINLRVDIRIPEDYIPQMNLRLNFYKRISSLEKLAEMELLRQEMEDRFGPLPTSVSNLITYGGVKFIAEKLKIKSLDRMGNRLYISWPLPADSVWPKLLSVLKKRKGTIHPQGIVEIPLSPTTAEGITAETLAVLKELYD